MTVIAVAAECNDGARGARIFLAMFFLILLFEAINSSRAIGITRHLDHQKK